LQLGIGGIGTPRQVRNHLRTLADTGVDQTVFIQQCGKAKHENICASLELFAKDVMGEFVEGEEQRERDKAEELAPFVAAAFARKEKMLALRPEEVSEVLPYGYAVAEGQNEFEFVG